MMRKLTFVFITACVAIFVCANIVSAQIVKDGLVAYWSMDKNTINGDKLNDLIGKNEGTIKGAKSVAGKIGEALEFNGTSDRVDIPGTDVLNFNGKKALSVAAWINVSGVGTGCCGQIVGQRDLNTYALRYDNRDAGAEIELIVCPGWVGDGASFGLPVPKAGEWHHVTGVCNGTQLLMYLDGKLGDKGTIAFPGTITGGGPATVIGGSNADGYFKGMIDEVLIYNKALSEKEIVQNYQSKFVGGMAIDISGKVAACWGDLKRKINE